MKRIQCACLAQTIHFTPKEDIAPAEAAALLKQEVAAYKLGLERRRTKYQVESESTLPDGSIVLKLRRQYNAYPCGDYLA